MVTAVTLTEPLFSELGALFYFFLVLPILSCVYLALYSQNACVCMCLCVCVCVCAHLE